MSGKFAVLWMLAGSVGAAAQEPVDLATIARIKEEGQQRSQVLATFNHFTNVIGPRLTGTPAYKQSAEWARQQLERWGLSNSHLEAFEFGRGWTLEKLNLELTGPRYFPLIGFPQAWSPSTKAAVPATPVNIAAKTREEGRARADRLRGAIVLRA